MKKNVFVAAMAASFCLLPANVTFAQEIKGPAELVWNQCDFESDAGIPVLSEDDPNIESKNFKFLASNMETFQVVDNPAKDLRNRSEKCLTFMRVPSWDGWFNFQTKDPNNYIDLSKWEKIVLDVRCPDVPLQSYILDLVYIDPVTQEQSNYCRFDLWPNLSASNNWQTLTFDLAEIDYNTGFGASDLKKVNDFLMWYAVWDGSTSEVPVFIDNIRLTRSVVLPDGNGIEIVETGKLSVSPNPGAETILLKGVSGKVTVFNMSGAQMTAIPNYEEGAAINVNSWQKGMYIIQTEKGVLKFLRK
jgi:hypothetical protein